MFLTQIWPRLTFFSIFEEESNISVVIKAKCIFSSFFCNLIKPQRGHIMFSKHCTITWKKLPKVFVGNGAEEFEEKYITRILTIFCGSCHYKLLFQSNLRSWYDILRNIKTLRRTRLSGYILSNWDRLRCDKWKTSFNSKDII